MKEYKLKQWYPTLPKGWKDVNPIVVVEKNGRYELHPSLKVDSSYRGGTLISISTPSEVENNPEFWEEIKPVEKDYEILKLKAGDNLFAKFRDFSGRERWIRKDGSPDEGYYDNLQVGGTYGTSPFEIYSVKRLSDGEVFTVGDSISAEHKQWNNVHIVKFEENDRDIWVKNSSGGCHSISDIVINTNPQPLFTTEDGIDIYNGDTYYWVGDDNYRDNGICKKWEVSKPCKIENNHVSFVTGVHPFSTKEAAEHYALLNKRSLSLSEVAKVIHETYRSEQGSIDYLNIAYDKLKSIVKSKNS